MTPFVQHDGIAAPLLRPNIDTDAIIPSREMKRVSKSGLGIGLFAAWRYSDASSRTLQDSFVLNDSAYAGTSILLAGANFGCGSSREHAVWALQEFGFRVILAPSFGAIFERNCYNNGLLPVQLDKDTIHHVAQMCAQDPQGKRLRVDLESQTITLPDESTLSFSTPEVQRQMLLNGWDPVDRTLQLKSQIDAFQKQDRLKRPWAWQITQPESAI